MPFLTVYRIVSSFASPHVLVALDAPVSLIPSPIPWPPKLLVEPGRVDVNTFLVPSWRRGNLAEFHLGGEEIWVLY